MNLAVEKVLFIFSLCADNEANVRIGKHNSSSTRILNCELSLAILTGNATCKHTQRGDFSIRAFYNNHQTLTNGPRQVIAVECLHVLNLERIQV